MLEPYKPIYTAKEISKTLKLGVTAVYDLMNSGKLPYIILGSRKVRGVDLEKFINTYPAEEVDNIG